MNSRKRATAGIVIAFLISGILFLLFSTSTGKAIPFESEDVNAKIIEPKAGQVYRMDGY